MTQLTRILPTAVALILTACGAGGDGAGDAAEAEDADEAGVLLKWVPPSQYTDGGAFADDAVTEYRLYVDQEIVRRLEPNLTEYFLPLPPGEWEVTVSSVVGDTESRLSEPLNVVIE